MRGELLRAKIKNRGLKVQYVAKEVGLSRGGFSKKMNGHSFFNSDEISRLIDILGLSVEEVYEIFLSRK